MKNILKLKAEMKYPVERGLRVSRLNHMQVWRYDGGACVRKKILIVDEDNTLAVLNTRLETEGYQVINVRNGREVLELIEAEKPDLVLLDGMIPSANGYQVCREIKQDPRFSKIPILMLTAKNAENELNEGKEAGGGKGYVKKPYNSRELTDKIQQFIK